LELERFLADVVFDHGFGNRRSIATSVFNAMQGRICIDAPSLSVFDDVQAT